MRWILCLLVCAALGNNNGVGKTPAMGWSTWCTMSECGQSGLSTGQSYHDVCYESEILSVAEAMVANGMRAAGFEYLEVDDCWGAMTRDAHGNLQGDPDRFPNGMASFIQKAHALGFKVGLYTSAGATTCNSGQRPHPIPGSYKHYEQDAKTLASWGVDMVRMDWCDWHFNDTVLIPGVETKVMHDALNKTGRPIWFYFHCIPVPPNIEWCGEYGNSFGVWLDHHDNWASTADIIHHIRHHLDFAGPYRWPDADFLMTGGAGCNNATAGVRCPGQTDDEYRSEFTIWALAAGQMLVAADVRNMSALQRDILLNTEVLEMFNDPLGELGIQITNDTKTEATVWARRLVNKCAAVAFLNEGNSPVTISVDFTEIPRMGWNRNTKLSVRDMWSHTALGTHTGSLSASGVGKHQTRLFKLCPV